MSMDEIKVRLMVDGAGSAAAEVRAFAGGLNDVGAAAGGARGGTEKLAESIRRLTTTAQYGGGLLVMLPTLAGLARGLIEAADSVSTLRSRLLLSTGTTAAAASAFDALYRVAQTSRASFTELGATFATLTRAGQQVGVSQQRMLTVTQAIGNAMAISGGSAESMRAALVQLGQGLSSGTLRGEELNSVMEQAPRLAQALADGMGVPLGQLRELGKQGEITSKMVISALEKSAPKLAEELSKATMTVGQSLTLLGNSTTRFVGDLDRATGSSATLASAMKGVSEALDSVGEFIRKHEPMFAILGAAVMGVAATVAMYAFGAAIGAVSVALAGLAAVLLANPVVLAVLGLRVVAFAGVAALKVFQATADGIKDSIAALETANAASRVALERAGGRTQAVDHINKVIVERNEAIKKLRQELALLQAGDTSSPAEDARFAAHLAATKAQEAADDKLTAIRAKLGQVDDGYIKTVKELVALRQDGFLKEGEYVALIKQAAGEHYKTGDAAKKQAEAYQTLLKGYADGARAAALKVAENATEAESGQKLTEATKAYIALMADVRDGKVKLADIEREHTKGQGDSTAAILRNAMAQSQALQRAAEGAKVAAELAKAQDAYVAGLAKTTAGLDEQIAKEAENYIEMVSGKAALDAYTQGKLENARATALMNEILESGLDGDARAAAAYAAQAESLGRLIAMKKLNASTAAAKTGRESVDAFLGADVGANIAEGFDKASQSLSAFVKGFQALVAIDGAYEKQRQAAGITAKQLAQLDAKQQGAQINAYGTLAGAAKGFFKEGTKGYKALEAAERTFRAFELAISVKTALEKMGLIGAVTTAKVAGDAAQAASATASIPVEVAAAAAKGTAAAAAGVANQAAGDPYTAFPRMALMAAAMAALGFATGAFGGGGGASPPPTNTGTGTVLGDAGAKSESIAKAIEALADVDTMTMRYSAQMLDALRGIQANISGLATLIVRDPKLGSAAAGIDTKFQGNALNDLLIGREFASLPLIGGFMAAVQSKLPGLFGRKTSITGQGITAAPQTLGQITRGNFDASYYADTITKNKFLGITTSTSAGTQLQAASGELERQFTLIFQGFSDTVKAAAGPLGVALGTVQERLEGFVVDIGRINFDGLTGEQISERLTAVFGAAGDSIAQAVLPGVDAFQQVGEGYLQTVVRVATGVEAAQLALEQLGVSAIGLGDVARKQADVAAEIVRQSIVAAETQGRMTNLMGPHLAPLVSSIGQIMATLGGSAADLASTYTALLGVRGALLSVGASGADLSVAMIRGAGGLDALASSLSDYLDNFFTDQERTAAGMARLGEQMARVGINTVPQTREAFRALVQGLDTSTEAGARQYAQLIGLSQAFADLVPATEAAMNAARSAADIAGERTSLEQALLQAQGDTVALRALELAKLDPSNRALQERIWALQGEQAATAAVAQAQAAIASQRAGLEQQLLQLQGDTAALRALERLKLDDSNRALFDQIAALQDLKAATEAAATAAQAAAAAEQAIASQRAGLEQQLLQLQGDSAALRARELLALDPSNRALQQRIFDLQDAQAADTAAAQAAKEAADQAASLRDAWRSVGATIADEVRRILGLVGGPGQNLSSVRAQFALATAQARAGDKDAASSLPELSRTMLELAGATASSAQEMALIRASTAASLAQTLRLLEWRGADPLPAFAAGGRHAGGLRLVGERGPEIEATGPARIWSAQQTAGMLGGGTARLEALVESLVAEVEGLRSEMDGLRFEARAIAGHTSTTAKIFGRVTQAGDSVSTTVAP